MNRKRVLYGVVSAIIIGLFDLIFFTLSGFDHSASAWIALAFIHLAFLAMVLTPALIHKGANPVVFGLPLFMFSMAYFGAQFLVGLIIILISPKTLTFSLLLQIVMMGIYLIAAIVCMLTNEDSAEQERQSQRGRMFLQSCMARLRAIQNMSVERSQSKSIEYIIDLISSSPVHSCDQALPVEESIAYEIDRLESAVHKQTEGEDVAQIINRIANLVSERNQILKLNG